MNEEQVQQKFMQFKFFQEQMEQLAKQVQQLHLQNQEVEAAYQAVEAIEQAQAQTEMLAPLAEGLFMKVQLQDSQKVILNVGASMAVEKKVSDVKTQLQEQKQELALRIIEGEAVLQQLHQQTMKIYKEIEPHLQKE